MPNLSVRVNPNESLKLWPAAKVDPNVRHGGTPAGAPLATVVADAGGLATFSVTSRIEYAAQRADGRFLFLMDSQTRGKAS